MGEDMGHTLVEKIIGKKVGHEVNPGDIVTVDVDWCMIDDIMVPFAVQKFQEMCFSKVANPDSVVLIYDHFLPATQVDDTRHFRVGDEFAEKYGIKKEDAIVEGKPQFSGRNLAVGIRKK